ncbi:MAG TPA: helix-turn-helix domain-containing protein [Chthoniobacterales bacterium]
MDDPTKQRAVPFHGMDDYTPFGGESGGVYVGKFQNSVKYLPNRMRLHRHHYFEIFWLDGDGAHVNDFEVYRITAPSLVFVTPGQVHRWMNGPGMHGDFICFTQTFFDADAPPPSPLLNYTFWYPHETAPVLAVPAHATDDVAMIFGQMEREFAGKSEGFETALRALLEVLFIRAERLFKQSAATAKPDRDSALVRQFRLALETHFSAIQSVADYARMLKMSPDRLSKAVHERIGQPASELIRQRMLLEAKRLLAHTDMTVSEIAYALNFSDPSYFSRFFRRETDQAPGEFRNSAGARE